MSHESKLDMSERRQTRQETSETLRSSLLQWNLRDRYVVGSKETEHYLVRHPSNMNTKSMPTLQYSLQASKGRKSGRGG